MILYGLSSTTNRRNKTMSKLLNETLYKSRRVGNEQMLQAPLGTTGYYRREVSPDGMTITYRKVA